MNRSNKTMKRRLDGWGWYHQIISLNNTYYVVLSGSKRPQPCLQDDGKASNAGLRLCGYTLADFPRGSKSGS